MINIRSEKVNLLYLPRFSSAFDLHERLILCERTVLPLDASS